MKARGPAFGPGPAFGLGPPGRAPGIQGCQDDSSSLKHVKGSSLARVPLAAITVTTLIGEPVRPAGQGPGTCPGLARTPHRIPLGPGRHGASASSREQSQGLPGQ